jgi:hypothetical protein
MEARCQNTRCSTLMGAQFVGRRPALRVVNIADGQAGDDEEQEECAAALRPIVTLPSTATVTRRGGVSQTVKGYERVRRQRSSEPYASSSPLLGRPPPGMPQTAWHAAVPSNSRMALLPIVSRANRFLSCHGRSITLDNLLSMAYCFDLCSREQRGWPSDAAQRDGICRVQALGRALFIHIWSFGRCVPQRNERRSLPQIRARPNGLVCLPWSMFHG